MSDTTIWGSTSSIIASSNAQERKPQASLDKDAFLRLLITQMKYQDPLNPVDDKQFLAQMAQFTALEQQQNLVTSMEFQQAYAMIGKSVYAYYYDDAAGEYREIDGLVNAVTKVGSNAYLTVNGQDVPMDKIGFVYDDYYNTNQLNSIMESVATTRDIALIGRHIQAITVDADGDATGFVEGPVEYVKFNGQVAVLVVGGKEVYPGEVALVSDRMLLTGGQIKAVLYDAEGTIEFVAGKIQGVSITNNKASLTVLTSRTSEDDEGNTVVTPVIKSVPIEKINYVTEALQMLGEDINYKGYYGTVNSVTISGGVPLLDLSSGMQLAYTYYRGLTDEDE
jgi:flagellar basal-body rod modification protein FlgD